MNKLTMIGMMAVSLVTPLKALAQTEGTVECRGLMDGGTYENLVVSEAGCVLSSAVVTGNLIVKAGLGPSIWNTVVHGNVITETPPGGIGAAESVSLVASTVQGNLVLAQGTMLVMAETTIQGQVSVMGAILSGTLVDIHGSVDVRGGTADLLPIGLVGGTIGGDVRLVDNISSAALVVELMEVTVNGSVEVTGNTYVQIEGNTIHGSLRCEGNTHVVDTGRPNTVSGSSFGQCSTF